MSALVYINSKQCRPCKLPPGIYDFRPNYEHVNVPVFSLPQFRFRFSSKNKELQQNYSLFDQIPSIKSKT